MVALFCVACVGLDDGQMEADSAKAGDAIRLRFAQVRESATRDSIARKLVEKAKSDSAAIVARAREDSQRVALGLPSMAQLSEMVPMLSPDSMPEIPLNVRAALRGRGCLVPQYFNGERRNAYGGAFSAKGAAEWAVMCSVNGDSQILIIASSTGAVVDSVALGNDAEAMDHDNGKWDFTRTFAVYRLGPGDMDEIPASLPRPIDHDALDIPIFGKASSAHYLVRGKWYYVMTAD
jgi:hypothetical protein